ncbi:MAG: 5'-3' exonuclease H3TH domain-containing protein [Thiohalobacterales bacterium]|nr:5'-3' exonuclease H3TH domain-containing protein [Thiohalobacterales bacterium]
MVGHERCVYLVDASIYIFRAYYSVPDTLTNADGQLINALHGFAGFLGSFLDEVNPVHMAVVFDESLTTSFRNEIYPPYKANRESPPEELKQQFGWCRHLVRSLGIAEYASEHYEADDLIGTLAAGLRAQGFSIVILSADKDLAQLVNEGDMLWDYSRQRKHTYEKIPDWLGVRAEQVADWLALTGDSVDNIPGIPGIGPKTAAALLEHYPTLEDLFSDLEAVAGLQIRGAARVQKLLQEHRDSALLARQLTGVAIDPAMRITAGDIARRSVNGEEVAAACDELGLGRMTRARLSRTVLT